MEATPATSPGTSSVDTPVGDQVGPYGTVGGTDGSGFAQVVGPGPLDSPGDETPLLKHDQLKEAKRHKSLAFEATLAPLVGKDGGFTGDSIRVRIPKIISSVIDTNHGLVSEEVLDGLRRLKDEVLADCMLEPIASAETGWDAYMEEHRYETWMTAPWFYVENYLYQRILTITNFAKDGLDPFHPSKEAALFKTIPQIGALKELAHTGKVFDLFRRSLWGNVADMSASGGQASDAKNDHDESQDHRILVNDVLAVQNYLSALTGTRRIAVVTDNAGVELVADIVLVYGLLRHGLADDVTFILKTQPVFVSDATRRDIEETYQWMSKHGMEDIVNYVLSKSRLTTNAFFTSPVPMRDMPQNMRDLFQTMHLVIFKGDANYRRLLGDLHWPYTTPFSHVMRTFPVPCIAVRTCKAEIVVGLTDDVIESASKEHSDWLTSGHFGMCQAYFPSIITPDEPAAAAAAAAAASASAVDVSAQRDAQALGVRHVPVQ